jgi:hypothetical protein
VSDLKNFLQKTYDADLAKSAVTYEAHVVAQQHLMKTKRTMQRIESDLREAKAAAVDATAAVDRKRKAAAYAEDGFNSDILLARHCYGLQRAAKTTAPAPPALINRPVYSPVDGGDTKEVSMYGLFNHVYALIHEKYSKFVVSWKPRALSLRLQRCCMSSARASSEQKDCG